MMPCGADCSSQGGSCGPPDPSFFFNKELSEHTRPVEPGGLLSAVSTYLPPAPSEILCPSSPPAHLGRMDRQGAHPV